MCVELLTQKPEGSKVSMITPQSNCLDERQNRSQVHLKAKPAWSQHAAASQSLEADVRTLTKLENSEPEEHKPTTE